MDVKVQRGVAIIPRDKIEVVVELKTPVNTSKAVALFGGSIYGSNCNYTNSDIWDVRLDLIDDQHIKATRAYPSFFNDEVSWQCWSL